MRTFALFFAMLASTIAHARVEQNECVPSVEASVAALAQAPAKTNISVDAEGFMPGDFFTKRLDADLGYENHFQGVARVRDSDTVVVSGGVKQSKEGYLFVGKLGETSLISSIKIDDPVHWHVGGLAQLGEIVMVPLEQHSPIYSSRVLFYDFSDPAAPKKLGVEIDRANAPAGAVALEKLPDGRFLAFVYGANYLDVYYSKTTALEDGFSDSIAHMPSGKKVSSGEGISLVRQCDGKLFYFDFNNEGPVAPYLNGINQMRVHEVVGATGAATDNVGLQKLGAYKMNCGKFCNFAADGTTYVSSDQKLHVYSTGFYRAESGTKLPMAEFVEK